MAKVRFIRQAYPRGGGIIMPAGAVRTLSAEQLQTYPRDSYASPGKSKAGKAGKADAAGKPAAT